MADINLLPEELREKEKKELESVKKVPKSVRIEMTSPTLEPKSKQLKKPKPSLLSRLFAKKIMPTKKVLPPPEPKAPKAPDLDMSRPTKKVLHIPRPEKSSAQTKDTVLNFNFGNKQNFEKRKSSPPSTEPKVNTDEKKLVPPTSQVIEIIQKAKKPNKKLTINLFGWLKPKRYKAREADDGKVIKKEKDKPGYSHKAKEPAEKKVGFDINLIPKELAVQQQLELPKKMFVSGLIVFVSILIIGVAYLGITWYQLNVNRQIQELQIEIKGLNDQIAAQEKFKLAALDVQQRLKIVNELLNKHMYWTKFFELLEKYTIPEVSFGSFSMSGTEGLGLTATGKDYASVAKQLIAFEQADDFIADVEINSASASVNENNDYQQVSFSINLTFIPGIFLNPIK